MSIRYLLLILAAFLLQCTSQPRGLALRPGMVLTRSSNILPGVYFLPTGSSADTAALVIEGENIVIDFQGAVLIGDTVLTQPDAFKGLGILVRAGQNITLKNVSIRGYQTGILATGIEALHLSGCDLSYNYRQEPGSQQAPEAGVGSSGFHQNEQDEWLRYGAGIYLKNCAGAQVDNCRVSGGQHALMLSGCNEGLFFNNEFTFNSGVGIALYRSSRNRILHNRLDWNVGSSQSPSPRNQASAGLLVYTESHENTIAYNSATHCGDGLLLWPGQPAMDTGKGGCNDNLIYGNDFSYAATHGVEITFSRNKVINNRIESCEYGIWGGYSYNCIFAGNFLHANRYGIAIEHGQDNYIDRNVITGGQTGISLWQRRTQPASGYIQARDTRSRDYLIVNNFFSQTDTALHILESLSVSASDNVFGGFKVLLHNNRPVDFSRNQIQTPVRPAPWMAQNEWIQDTALTPPAREALQMVQYAPPRIPGGKNALLPPGHPYGRDMVHITPWGPYDFGYPLCRRIDSTATGRLTFQVLGPAGIWKVNRAHGLSQLSAESGSVPATFTAQVDPGAPAGIRIDLSYAGEAVRDVFGRESPAGQSFSFSYRAAPTPEAPLQ